jgi:hypothetical protein
MNNTSVEEIALNDTVREELCDSIRRFGLRTESPGKIGAMLEITCPNCRTEIEALVLAFRNGIPGDLMWNPSREPMQLLFKRLVKRLQQNEGMLPHVARWAVESWVLALSLIKERREQEVTMSNVSSNMNLLMLLKNVLKTKRKWFLF